MLGLLTVERVEQFHILSHDLGGPPSVALGMYTYYCAATATILEAPTLPRASTAWVCNAISGHHGLLAMPGTPWNTK
jgi:hypothetical protein